MSTSPCCELCGATDGVFVAMQPGPDGKEWWYCVADYIDGLHPGKLGRIPARYRDDLEVTRETSGEAVIPSTGERVPWKLSTREPKTLKKRKTG
jgi:hypothetical protein